MSAADTILDHRQRIRRVMMHINRNLDRKIYLDRLAETACFSKFHFIRVFESLMGESPQHYVMRKKMERAGFHLIEKKHRITDIALNSAYGTSSSFCKAFKRHFAMSPRRFRDTVSRDQYAKINHPFRALVGRRNNSLEAPGVVDPAIRSFPPLTVICMENRGVINGGFLTTALTSFRKFRNKIETLGLAGDIGNSVSIYPFRPTGVDDRHATNLVGALIDREIRPAAGLRCLSFPGGRYAVFRHFGAYEFIFQTWNRAYMSWFPKSGRMLRDVPPMEIHIDTDGGGDDFYLQAFLLIPIV